MRRTPAQARILKFATYEVDRDSGELYKSGVRQKLTGQPFEVLCLLLERPNQIVTREEFRKRIWSKDTFVDYDLALRKAITRLRESLGDSAENPRFIETIPRKGYRFIATVESNGQVAASKIMSAASEQTQEAVPFPPKPSDSSLLAPSSLPRDAKFAWASPRGFLYGLTVAVWLIGLGFAIREYLRRQAPTHRPMTERQLTHNTSERRGLSNAISPDGQYVASTTTAGLYIGNVDTGEVHEIPLPEELKANLWFVSWFPDNEKLLFTVQTDTDHDIWSTSILGGSPRKLRAGCNQGSVSPDGTQIVASCENNHEVWIMGPNGDNGRKLGGTELESYGGFAWSPTGRRVAYVKTKLDSSSRLIETEGRTRVIETVSLDGGPPSFVLSDPGLIEARQMVSNLAWLHDGRMVFVLATNEGCNLWEIRVDPLTGKPITSARQMTKWDKWDALSLSISRDDRHLLVDKLHVRQDIYVGALKDNGTHLEAPRRLTFSDSENLVFGWSPDSTAIFFKSDRTGGVQSYQQKLDREDGERLAPVGEFSSAVVSPDGRSMLYWSSHGGTDPSQLMRLRVPQGVPEQVLQLPTGEVADFDCPQRATSDCVLYRMEKDQLIFYELKPLHGLGKELKRFRVSAPREFALSPDGMRFATLPGRRTGKVVVLDLSNGKEESITLPVRWAVWSLSWTPDGKGMYLAAQDKGYFLVHLALDGKFRVLLDRGRDNWLSVPMASRDFRHLAFSQQIFENNAWVLENF